MHYDNTRRYGFTEIKALGKNNSYKNGKIARRRADNLTPKEGYSARFDHFGPGEDSGVLKHDSQVTQEVSGFLQGRRRDDKPFFMMAGYLAPHFPLIVPKEFWAPYKGKVPMPEIPEGHIESLPLNYKHLRVGFDMDDVPEDIVRRGRELYYGLTQWLDAEIGKLLAALDNSEVADNTVVVYTTDHGENMGEHGLWWKNCVYDTAARVPLIVSWPARWSGGQRRAGACSLVDLVQTIADLGEARAPEDWDGDSLCGTLDDPRAPWKDFALSEYYAHNIASGYVMVRMGKWKYVYHTPPDDRHGEARELYDLEADPGEFHNLADDPKHAGRIERMHAAMLAELPEHPNQTEARCRTEIAKGYERKDAPPRAASSRRRR